MAYKEFESERYSKVIEMERCSYIASDFDPEAGYKCPDVKVEIVNTITATKAYGVTYVQDDTLAFGEEKVVQSADGFLGSQINV